MTNYYIDDFVKQDILNNKNNYLFFDISENTIEALDKKCNFILSKQALEWLPYKLEYKEFIHIYTKTFYFKKS